MKNRSRLIPILLVAMGANNVVLLVSSVTAGTFVFTLLPFVLAVYIKDGTFPRYIKPATFIYLFVELIIAAASLWFVQATFAAEGGFSFDVPGQTLLLATVAVVRLVLSGVTLYFLAGQTIGLPAKD